MPSHLILALPPEWLAAAAWSANKAAVRSGAAGAWADAAHASLPAASGVVGVLVLIVWQNARDWRDRVSRMHRSTVALGIEISLIAEALCDTGWHRGAIGARYERRAMPRSVYDALGNSGVLGELDPGTQDLPCLFCWKAPLGDHEAMDNAIEEAVSAAERAKRASAPGSGPWARRILRLSPKSGPARTGGDAAGGPQNGGAGNAGDGGALRDRGSRPI